MFKVKWTPGTCVLSATGVTGVTGATAGGPLGAKPAGQPPKKGGAKPYMPAPGSFCTRWVGEGGPCTLSGVDAPKSGMVCCDPSLSRSYGAGEPVSILACGLKQAKGGDWVPAGCQRQAV